MQLLRKSGSLNDEHQLKQIQKDVMLKHMIKTLCNCKSKTLKNKVKYTIKY